MKEDIYALVLNLYSLKRTPADSWPELPSLLFL